jgi:hypothetical protein
MLIWYQYVALKKAKKKSGSWLWSNQLFFRVAELGFAFSHQTKKGYFFLLRCWILGLSTHPVVSGKRICLSFEFTRCCQFFCKLLEGEKLKWVWGQVLWVNSYLSPFHIWWGTMFRNIVVHCKFQHSTYPCETIFWVLISYYYKVIDVALLNWAKGWSYVSKQAVIAWLHFHLENI